MGFSRRAIQIVFLVLSLFAVGCQSARKMQSVNVLDLGAQGDGVALNTSTFQRAIDSCSQAGGGIVHIPAGRFVTGTLVLKNNVTLHLDQDAVLLGSTSAADYSNPDPFLDGTGAPLGAALLVGVNAKHVAIEGEGTIDGQGKLVAAAQGGGKNYRMRPFLIRMVRCEDVRLSGLSLTHPGAWTVNFFQCRDVKADHLTINSRGLANNDGIDVDSCRGVRIQDCHIDTGDDAICFKTTSTVPTRDVQVSNCWLKSDCGAIKCGTESMGDFDHIAITHCEIHDTRLGGIKLLCVDGGHLQNISISDITMDNVATPIFVRLGARLGTFRAGDKKQSIGALRDVVIRNVKARSADKAQLSPPSGIFITGIPGHRIENLTLDHIAIELPGGGEAAQGAQVVEEKIAAYPEINRFAPRLPAYGLYARHMSGLRVRDLIFTLRAPDGRRAIVCEDAAQSKFTHTEFPGRVDAASFNESETK